MGNIISISRRTDIPAFYTDWLITRLREGYTFVRNPYSKESLYVSLRPEDILGMVFWSKDFSPLLSRIEEIEKVTKNLFFHFTITGLSKEIEMNTPPSGDAIRDLIFISRRYSSEHVIWRFDPICVTDRISLEEHTNAFLRCAEALKGYVHTCYISFVNPYPKVVRNFQRYTTHELINLPLEERRIYARGLASLAEQYGIQLYACCNDYLLSDNIHKGSCINRNHLAHVWGLGGIGYERPSPTRKECACTRSIDIGAYDTCPHGCIYCYANMDKDKALYFYKFQDPDWNALDGEVEWAVRSDLRRVSP